MLNALFQAHRQHVLIYHETEILQTSWPALFVMVIALLLSGCQWITASTSLNKPALVK
jgi:hypothetical protein